MRYTSQKNIGKKWVISRNQYILLLFGWNFIFSVNLHTSFWKKTRFFIKKRQQWAHLLGEMSSFLPIWTPPIDLGGEVLKKCPFRPPPPSNKCEMDTFSTAVITVFHLRNKSNNQHLKSSEICQWCLKLGYRSIPEI